PFEEVKGYRAVGEQAVVEGAEVKPRAVVGLVLRPDPAEGELADLVGQRLTGPDDVAVDLIGDLVAGDRGIGFEVRDRAVAGPPLRVTSCIHYEPAAPRGVVDEPAELGKGVAVQPDLARQALGVEGPSFVKSGDVEEPPERGPSGRLGRDGALE